MNNDTNRPVAVDAIGTIAVDAMGGDFGVNVQVEGAIRAFKENGISSILVGAEQLLKDSINSFGAAELKLQIVDAPEIIEMDESPSKAVRKKPNSSLCVAYELVQSNKAIAILSAGNSGAMMAAGRIICGLMPGIERPAIAALIPAPGEELPNCVLDSGANVDCHAHNLVQFAVMGSIYYSSLFPIDRPKVALMSNGSEPTKGTDTIRDAATILRSLPSLNYVGYVEGRDIANGAAHVIVCDGFVGNVILKSMEGCVRLIAKQLQLESQKSLLGKFSLFLSRRIFQNVFKEKFDYSAYGGAPLLGLRKLALVLHGASDARAVTNALRAAKSFHDSSMTDKIAHELSHLEDSYSDYGGGVYTGLRTSGLKAEK